MRAPYHAPGEVIAQRPDAVSKDHSVWEGNMIFRRVGQTRVHSLQSASSSGASARPTPLTDVGERSRQARWGNALQAVVRPVRILW